MTLRAMRESLTAYVENSGLHEEVQNEKATSLPRWLQVRDEFGLSRGDKGVFCRFA